MRWSPDGKALHYVLTRGGVSNLWELPLSEAPPKQITNFRDREFSAYQWSRDGKRLALLRGSTRVDVVLLSHFN